MFQFPPGPTPNSFPPDPAPVLTELELLSTDPIEESRQEYLAVMASLVAADLPHLSHEMRHHDRHLWLNGLDVLTRDILDRADDFAYRLRRYTEEPEA